LGHTEQHRLRHARENRAFMVQLLAERLIGFAADTMLIGNLLRALFTHHIIQTGEHSAIGAVCRRGKSDFRTRGHGACETERKQCGDHVPRAERCHVECLQSVMRKDAVIRNDVPRMDMRKLVGRNFSRLRRTKGLTQEDVEARSGFSQ